MGKRKFRLSTHRKNEERKRQKKEINSHTNEELSLVVSIPRCHVTVQVPALIVSLPLSSYRDGLVTSVSSLQTRLKSLSLPKSWILVSSHPLVLSKLRVLPKASQAQIQFTLSISAELKWSLCVLNMPVSRTHCTLLSSVPTTLCSASDVYSLIRNVDAAKICQGNQEKKFLDCFQKRSLTLHGFGSRGAFLDDLSLPTGSTIRHTHCQLLLSLDSSSVRCSGCSAYRKTLSIQNARMQGKQEDHSTPSSHVNHRYQPLPDLVDRLSQLHNQLRLVSKQRDRLKAKIKKVLESEGVILDEETHEDLKQMISSPDSSVLFKDLPKDSFQYIFWQQQLEAASKKKAQNMRWHPLMIRWCLSLRHRSSGAYEALRSSGCVKLPSQRTLRDYTYYVKAATGFSSDVDNMLMEAAKVCCCPEREKNVILLLDEMHVKEDIVYDKHSGAMIGFANLGDINDHLLQFESSLLEDKQTSPQLAKSMMVFMVRGLFSKLQFPYAQFPCANLSGDLLYEPFWEAVGRVENCGLKVLGATLDGNSVNRRLIKLHGPSADLIYKVDNPFAKEKRSLFFFSDPPHLVKTVRNCMLSKSRNLWNDGYYISWKHIQKLYDRDTQAGMGIRMVPKLKYEHVSLTSFSKMRVDLAAQVLSESVSKALQLVGGVEAAETSKFVGMIDKFFDILNVHNYTHGVHARKAFQMPYTTSKDKRLKWLEEDFLPYLDKWEDSVKRLPGLTKTQQGQMLLSAETRLGLRITSKSFVELIKYFFEQPDVKSFLSQRICQDPLENFFGCQRQRGAVHDNPNVHEFTKNTQALLVINSFCKGPSKGNCRGSVTENAHDQENINQPLPKRPRKSRNSKHLGLY